MWQYRKEIHQREPTPTIVQKQKDNIFQQECPFQIFFCFKRKGRKSCVFGKINHFNLIFGIRTWWFKLEYLNLVFGIWNFNLLFGIWTFYRFFYFFILFLFWVLNVRFKSWTDSKSCRTFHAHGKVIYEIITGMSI